MPSWTGKTDTILLFPFCFCSFSTKTLTACIAHLVEQWLSTAAVRVWSPVLAVGMDRTAKLNKVAFHWSLIHTVSGFHTFLLKTEHTDSVYCVFHYSNTAHRYEQKNACWNAKAQNQEKNTPGCCVVRSSFLFLQVFLEELKSLWCTLTMYALNSSLYVTCLVFETVCFSSPALWVRYTKGN